MCDRLLTVDKLTFSEWLQQEMDARGWRAADLARAAGVTDASISHIISETRKPGADMCRGIAKAFGEPEEKVFRRAGLLSPLQGPEEEVSFQELCELWRHLSSGDRQVLKEWADFRYKISRDSSPTD